MFLLSSLTIGIIVLGLIWIITLPQHYKENPSKIFNFYTLIRIAAIIITVIITAYTALISPLPKTGYEDFFQIIGIILYIAGFAFAVWAKLTMKEYWAGPAQHDTKAQTRLLTSGPYAYSRNPIYVGLLLLFVGYARAIHSPAIVLVIIYFYVFRSFIVKEEALLEKLFEKQYIEYKQKVPRWLKMY